MFVVDLDQALLVVASILQAAVSEVHHFFCFEISIRLHTMSNKIHTSFTALSGSTVGFWPVRSWRKGWVTGIWGTCGTNRGSVSISTAFRVTVRMAFRWILGACLKSQNNGREACSKLCSTTDRVLHSWSNLWEVFCCESKSQTSTNEVWNPLHLLRN